MLRMTPTRLYLFVADIRLVKRDFQRLKITGGAVSSLWKATMKGRPNYRVKERDGWFYVEYNPVYDVWVHHSRHFREELAIKQMRRMIRREAKA